jgi:hypothetical protein
MEPDPLSEWLHHITALLAMSLIAPFYVAAGFALYLTRRSQLEAWDLELGLRKMAQQHTPRSPNILLVCLAVFVLGFYLPEAAQANQVSRQDAKELIQQVLDDDAFGEEKRVEYWHYVGDQERQSDEEDSAHFPWLKSLIRSLAGGGELLLWILVLCLLAYLIRWYLKNRPTFGGALNPERAKRSAPAIVAGLDLRPETMPEDPAAKALELIEQGALREGLALLYRASLSRLVHHHAVAIKAGDTEGQCLHRSRSLQNPALLNYLTELTTVWQKLAYAHHQPPTDQLLGLCRTWPDHFEGQDEG